MTIIIAELSGNHNGDLEQAKELIDAAARAGCDMVKVQTYRAEDMPDDGGDYEKYRIPRDWYPVLFETAHEVGIPLFSSVFAPWAVDFLEQFNCPIYKIASPESTRLTDARYIQLASLIHRCNKPLWASSGMADFEEFSEAIDPEIMFYCKQGYPAAPLDDDELAFLSPWAEGFSDHTTGIVSALAAIKLGVTHIEKHFKLDDNCIDAAFSFNPIQMRRLSRLARLVFEE